MEGFSTDEICNILDVTRTNLGVLIFRARNRLRECLEAKALVSSEELAAAGWIRRMGVRLHLLMCRHCRAYVSQIRSLGALARSGWTVAEEAGDGRRRLEEDLLARASGKAPPAEE